MLVWVMGLVEFSSAVFGGILSYGVLEAGQRGRMNTFCFEDLCQEGEPCRTQGEVVRGLLGWAWRPQV